MYEIFEKLLERFGMTAYKFCKDTGVNASTISTWKKNQSIARPDLAKKVCEYFGVSIDYLMTGKEEIPEPNAEILEKDKKEIGRDLDRIMGEIENNIDGPLYYNGEPIDDESLELLRKALELGLTQLKRENKVKYNPNKNKKR